RVVLVEIGLLQFVVDRIELHAGLHLVALAHGKLGHAAGLVGADKDHVGLDPALKARILALLAAGQHDGQRHYRQDSRPSQKGLAQKGLARRSHVVLRSPKIRSRWTRNISFASSGACRANRLCQITAIIAGAIRICGNFARFLCWISPRTIPSSIAARMPASPFETTSR